MEVANPRDLAALLKPGMPANPALAWHPALTGAEQYGGAMEPAQKPDVAGLVQALGSARDAMGGSIADRMAHHGAQQQARMASGNFSPTPVTAETVDLADSVAGALAGTTRKVGKLFDYKGLNKVPDVPQVNIARPAPPARGYPDYVLKAIEPSNIKRMNEKVAAGIKMGGKEWYNTDQLRKAFIDELGEPAGNAAHKLYMDLVASTSTRSNVPTNIRNASYYFNLLQSGQPLPTEPPLPKPYGHIAQKQHIKQVTDVADRGGLDLMKNPKPSSFAQNLSGNQAPVTIDTHNVRALGLTDASGRPVDMPVGSHYGLLESIQQAAAKEMGLTPAQYQAGAWLGAGKETGLKSEVEPFLATFETVVARTAKARGVSKVQALRDFINGRAPLVGIGPLGAALASAMAVGAGEEAGDRPE